MRPTLSRRRVFIALGLAGVLATGSAITVAVKGRAYLVFESGSYQYRSDPKTKNVITHLHKASISSLTSLA